MRSLWMALLVALALTAQTAHAQETASEDTATEDAADADSLLTQEELQSLVAPVALFPDTLLIQIFVASTYPLDIIKAERLLEENEGASQDDLQTKIEEQGWDDSVSVLATAFPEVLIDMATHIEWTESVGNAMLAQSEDMLEAVQTLRKVATDNGALQDTEQQVVGVTQDDTGTETIVIQPADPQVVYVPSYDPVVVYDPKNDFGADDAVAAAIITFTALAVIDEIFDDDDPWHDYWRCRNCGGWHGEPIRHRPDRDIDIGGDLIIDRGDRTIVNPGKGGWKPDDKRRDEARDKISKRRGENGKTRVPVTKPDRGEEMREKLSKRANAPDISRDKVKARVERPSNPQRINRDKAVQRTGKKPAVNKPRAKVPAKPQKKITRSKPSKPRAKPPARKPSASRGGGVKRSAPANRTRAGSQRGRASAGRAKRR